MLIPAIYILSDKLKNHEIRQNFQIELQKACQAMGDACLLKTGEYHFSYRKRLQRFKEINWDNLDVPDDLLERLAPLYEWGITSKLNPKFVWASDKEMLRKWFEIKDMLESFFLWYESTRINHNFNGWGEYANYLDKRGAKEPLDLRIRSTLVTILSGIQGKRNAISPIKRTRRCLSIMPLLLFSLGPDFRIKSSFLSQAARLMGETSGDSDLNLWKKLVGKHLLTYYPTIVVEDALSSLC